MAEGRVVAAARDVAAEAAVAEDAVVAGAVVEEDVAELAVAVLEEPAAWVAAGKKATMSC